MRPIEEYLKNADADAQDVVNDLAGHLNDLNDRGKDLLDKACRYRIVRRVTDDRRKSGSVSDQDIADEKATRQAFAEANKDYCERTTRGASA